MARKKHRMRPHEPRESPAPETREEARPERPEPSGKKGAWNEETQSRISVIVFTLAGMVMGYLSILISPFAGNMFTILAGLVVSWMVSRSVQSFLGKKELKWIIGNGLFIYLFVWLIFWILFFNAGM
jgi:hypothetical protein